MALAALAACSEEQAVSSVSDQVASGATPSQPAPRPAKAPALAAAAKTAPKSANLSKETLAFLEGPLFSDDAEDVYSKLRLQRKQAGNPVTTLTDEVRWMNTLDETFATATRENKPVLLLTFVRENGDPHCDV